MIYSFFNIVLVCECRFRANLCTRKMPQEQAGSLIVELIFSHREMKVQQLYWSNLSKPKK